ncbi:MAG TPA: aminotransferase class IV [Pyrinomonadaceae bacterium]|nr:aminotransferase class IV [Pyrinomonadaceae bacterium]
MHGFVSFNHKIASASEAFLSSISSAALYGKGIFTTIAVYDKKPFLWEKHWRRLNENAEKTGIDLSEFAEGTVKDSLLEIIEKNEISNARARVTLFDEQASEIWLFETKRKTSILITTADFRKIENDFNLTVSPFRINSTSPLAGVKSCNYLENLLALEETKKRGFGEAIRLNEKDEIVSASTANVFWIKNKEIFTPALETGCLAGTTRELLIENFAVRQVEAGLNEIIEADEIFLTSAGIGICPANFGNINKRSLSNVPKLKNILDLPGAKS